MASIDAWFRFGEMRPPLTVKVWVMWSGREFVAARARHPATGADVWGEYRRGSDRPRPVALEGEPELWRPLNLAMWQLPLPEPVTAAEAGRMITERLRFTSVDDATAADLAAEMEAERNLARNVSHETRIDSGARVKQELQWWRDISLIKHKETAPDITLRSVEGRLMRAVACCGAGHVWDIRVSPIWKEIGEAAARALAGIEATTSPDIVPRFDPLPADEADFLTAMAWFAALYPPEQRPSCWMELDGMRRFNRPQKIIIWRARNVSLSYDEIGAELDRVDRNLSSKEYAKRAHAAGERVRRDFNLAVEDCWRLANGLANRKGVPPRVDHMAEVRERNRRARRASA